ncbi:MAG TPA: hypothetical protein VJ732_17230 [Bryobacteraceae bacterium]|nr:hypothetical protein [Bryobacteraceae bacterium]
MIIRASIILIAVSALLVAARKDLATARGENQDVIVTATIYIDAPAVKQVVGDELQGHYIVADVKVEPKYGKQIKIDRDDFVLRTDKDGDHCTPFAPSQIAGQGALIINQKGNQQGAASPGMVGIGGPIVVGGTGGVLGKGKSEKDQAPSAQAPQESGKGDPPLEKLLETKILREEKTLQPVSGLLYFPMEKQKMKNLELDYGGKENRISLRFK